MNDFDSITIEELRKLIRLFNNDEYVNELESYYYSKSFPEILGFSRKELVHSNFLAWILNDKANHQLLDFPIRKFLELIVIYKNTSENQTNKNLFDSIIVSNYSIIDIQIETEKIEKNVGRIDLYLEITIQINEQRVRLRLIIENKVSTKEHSDQTTKYYDCYERLKEKNIINLYIFLTPISSLDLMELQEPECSCKKYTQINYQSIVDFILEPALKKDITNRTKFIIREYLQSLSQPTIDQDDKYRQGLIMALGTDERNLLTKFWERNQKLILASLYAISSDPEQEKDVRDSASSALNGLSNSDKDRSLYSIIYNGATEVEKIKKSDIGYSTVKVLKDKGLIDKELFEFLRSDRSCGFTLLKTSDEATENEIKYRKYRVHNEPELIFDGKGYFIARNWGINNIDGFLTKMTERISKLEYIKH